LPWWCCGRAWTCLRIASYGGHALNPASLTALMVIGVGLAALVERARLALTSPVIVPFVLFTVVAAVGVPLAPSVSAAATEWLRLCSILIGYCLLYVVLTGQEKVRHALIAVLLSGAIPALVGIGQFVAGGKRTIGDYSRLTGTFLHPDPYGIYLGLLTVLAVALYAAAKGYVRPVSLVLLPLLIAALVGSYTRTGWVAGKVAGSPVSSENVEPCFGHSISRSSSHTSPSDRE